jgi:hypothetical protein
LFSNAEVLSMLDAKIFIYCTKNTAYSRRLHRKKRSDAPQFTYYYDNYVWPYHVIFNRHIYQLMAEPFQHELWIDDERKKQLQAEEEEGFFPDIAAGSVHFIDGEMAAQEVYNAAVSHLTNSIKDKLKVNQVI